MGSDRSALLIVEDDPRLGPIMVEVLGLDWDALVHNDEFPAKKVGKRYIIPIVPLARWMVTW